MTQLTGTDRQIKWAEKIRDEQAPRLKALRERVVAKVRQEALTSYLTNAIDNALAQTSAAYWIENHPAPNVMNFLLTVLSTDEAAVILFAKGEPPMPRDRMIKHLAANLGNKI